MLNALIRGTKETRENFFSPFNIMIDNAARMWTTFSIRITMWESDIFECSEKEPPLKKRDTRNKSSVITGYSRQLKILKKVEKSTVSLKKVKMICLTIES